MEQLQETDIFSSKRNKETVSSVMPMLTYEELVKQCQPGDILLVGLNRKGIGKILGIGVHLATRSNIDSSKLIMTKNQMGGYFNGSIKIWDRKEAFDKMIKRAYLMILIRPNATNQQKLKAENYMRDREGLGKGKADIYAFLDRNAPNKLKMDRTLMNSQSVEEFSGEMVCSTSIAMGYRSAGFYLFPGSDPLTVWPVDFLYSPNCQTIGKMVKSFGFQEYPEGVK